MKRLTEKGKRYYTFEQCKRIALALDTSMDYLAGLTDDPKPYPRNSQESLVNEKPPHIISKD